MGEGDGRVSAALKTQEKVLFLQFKPQSVFSSVQTASVTSGAWSVFQVSIASLSNVLIIFIFLASPRM